MSTTDTFVSPSKLKSNDPCWCGSGKKFKRCHKPSYERIVPGRLSPRRGCQRGSSRLRGPSPVGASDRSEPDVKTPDVIERLRRTGPAAAEVLAVTGAAVAPGVTTDELDRICHEATIAAGGYPSPLNYQGTYPKSLCTSINEVICHGIPDDRPLRDGDIVNLDVTVFREGVHGDTNATFLVGDVDAESSGWCG